MKGKKKDVSEEKEDRDSTVNVNPEKELIKEELMKKRTSPPFPQALHGKKGIKNASEILEVLRQVKVNIPLLDMIKQVPTYAKFLKDLCTIKRGLNVNKKAFLTEQVVEKALLDLGASVNLLPYCIYKQLGLGELKPTSITLSLAIDQKIPRVRKLIQFLSSLEGHSLLLQMQSSIVGMDLSNHSEEEEGPEEVCIIDTLVEEHCNQNMQDKLNESLGDLEEELSEPPDVLATLQSWRRREEILPLFNKEEGEVAKEETPKLNLKPLPVELKYTYLEENNQCLVVHLLLIIGEVFT
ncbi:hypothetical protein AAG906_000042 [Vitis piasezkii]